MKIILLEDDHIQASRIIDEMEHYFGMPKISLYSNASEFIKELPEICAVPPDLFLFDMMLQWSAVEDLASREIPSDFEYSQAGIHCAKAVLSSPKISSIPIILHTFVRAEVIQSTFGVMPKNVSIIGKEENTRSLMMMIRSVILASGSDAISCGSKDIFVVHGHDDEAKETAARFIEKLGGRAVVLHEQPNAGRTIIEKFEHYSNVAFAIVLLTPDDVGGKTSKSLKQRARQNVVFELGFFFAKLGRNKVCALHKEEVEIPSDIQGVIYTPMDKAGAWRIALARELKAAGIPLDYDKVI